MRTRVVFKTALPNLSSYKPTSNICRRNNMYGRYIDMVSRREIKNSPDYRLVCVCDGVHVYDPCTQIKLY